MGRRVALLISAIVIAAIGTTLVFLYAKGANDRAIADQSPQTVLVATAQIDAGTTAEQALAEAKMVPETLPEKAVADGAVGNVEAIKSKVALATIYPGQQILTQLFGDTANGEVTTLAIPKGQMAASFSFSDPARVAGFLQAGSKVAVFLTSSAGGANSPTTRLLLPRMTILAVGATTIQPPTDPTKANPEAPPRALMTLAVTQKQLEQLVHAQTLGELYLGLLKDDSQVSTSDSGVTANNLFR